MKENIDFINKKISGFTTNVDISIKLAIDTFHHSYVQFEDSFLWPAIHTNRIEPEEKNQITDILLTHVPSFIENCSVLTESRPRRDSNQVHYVRSYKFNEVEYIYIFKVFAEYMGGADQTEIVSRGKQGIAPSFHTDRVYFESLLIPVSNITRDVHGYVTDFIPIQIKDAIFKVSSDEEIRNFRSSVLFDEIDFSQVNNKITNHFSYGKQWKFNNLFYPIIIDYLSLCMNIITPYKKVVDLNAPVFARMFMNFIHQEDGSNMEITDKQFLCDYYESWKFERIFSKSGNPHWVMREHPFAEILKK